MKDFFELIRWNHWAKNVFVLAPLFFSGDYYDISNVAQVLKAFFIFCLVSSCVYIFNDLLDYEADSAHNKKRLRPLPSGRISKPMAMLILSIMFISVCLLLYTLRMPINFIYVVLLYALINLIYSMGLKHIPVLELILVSSDVRLGTIELLKPKLLANCCVNSYPLPLKPCIAPTAPPNKRVNILASACLNLLSNLIKLSIQPATLKPKDIGTAF